MSDTALGLIVLLVLIGIIFGAGFTTGVLWHVTKSSNPKARHRPEVPARPPIYDTVPDDVPYETPVRPDVEQYSPEWYETAYDDPAEPRRPPNVNEIL